MSSSFRNLTEPFDLNSSRETSAGLRWDERAVGWLWVDRWSGRFVCVSRGFGLSSEQLHSVIPPGLAAWKVYLFPYATTLTALSLVVSQRTGKRESGEFARRRTC